MILSNALLVLGLSGPDLVLVSGRQGERSGAVLGRQLRTVGLLGGAATTPVDTER